MKLATFMMPLHPPGRNPGETLAEDREAILLADRLGYIEGYVGEHLTDLSENITSCTMFLASLAHETRNIILGTGTINMPLARRSMQLMAEHVMPRVNAALRSPG